ncbi:cytochrome c [Vibrio sp. 10N.261.55.A7]|uniref:c-type cytochrome n=1 Tax=Vibrio sp. 10N.261.55.A7 TaxID=1880851 RepID=UPI000C836183|nr:cytochrome c [Vibrio sp. 10N.261.55.A7]
MYKLHLLTAKTLSYLYLLTAFTYTAGSYAGSNSGDVALGKQKSPSCIYCHGVTGKAPNPSYPNIDGQDAQYLYNAMKAYQDGHRTGPLADMMKAQLQHLNDQDLRDVAAYFSNAK